MQATQLEPRALLRAMFDAAVAAAQPAQILPQHLPAPPRGRTIVLGAGKASAAMAKAVEDHWPGPLEGLVVTRYGHAVPCARIEIVEAAHPVPDVAGQAAAARILTLAEGAGPDDLVLCLISGGGSSLLALPAKGLTLADKQAVNKALLASGADIAQMNTVRRHLSAIKGGRLAAAAHPAKVVSLLISDVPGDDPAAIASGPTIADPSTFADARAVLERYRINPPEAVRRHLAEAREETPKPGRFAAGRGRERDDCDTTAVARGGGHRRQSCRHHALAAGRRARGRGRRGRQGHGRDRPLGGSARPSTAAALRAAVRRRDDGHLARQGTWRPQCRVSARPGGGAGGPAGVWALAGDTDGIDGADKAAGAIVTPDTLARAIALGIEPRASLADNDGHGFFQALGDQLVTGPTLTNVNDFRAILVQPTAA